MSKIYLIKQDKEDLNNTLKNTTNTTLYLNFIKTNKKVKTLLNELYFLPDVINDIIFDYCVVELKVECCVFPNIQQIQVNLCDKNICNFNIFKRNNIFFCNLDDSINGILNTQVKNVNMIDFFDYYMKKFYNKKKYMNLKRSCFEKFITKNKSKNIIIKYSHTFGCMNTFLIINHKKLKHIIIMLKIIVNVMKKIV